MSRQFASRDFRVSNGLAGVSAAQPRYLLVKIGGYEFAVAAEHIKQLIPTPEIVPLPGAPAWCQGLLAFGQTAVPVLDSHLILGLVRGSGKAPVAVVLEPGVSSEFPVLAFSVDRLTITISIRPHELSPIRESSSLYFREFVTAAWRGRSRPCYLLNLAAMIPIAELNQLPAVLRGNLASN